MESFQQQRRAAPAHEQPDGSSSPPAAPAPAPAPVLLTSPAPEQARDGQAQQGAPDISARVSAAAAAADAQGPRTCWICYQDETDDDETTSEWRSPCPCVLVAHEKCLLDWIADMEAPNQRRRAGSRKGKILCPQCKSEIRLRRPRSIVVDAVRFGERLTSMLLLPGAILMFSSVTVATLSTIGKYQIWHVFGERDAMRILEPLSLVQFPAVINRPVAETLRHLNEHWRLHLGLPLIPTVLMASRSTIADHFLPFLPLIFFVSSGDPRDDMLRMTWPPSAACTIATLPYIRAIYNAWYERVWAPKEHQWLEEIQPRAGDEPEPVELDVRARGRDVHAENQAIRNLQELEALMEEVDDDWDDEDEQQDLIEEELDLDIDFDILADWNNGGAAENNNAADNPPAADAPAHIPLEGVPAPPEDPHFIDAAPAPNIPQVPREGPRRIRRERNLGRLSTAGLTDTILGAFFFPSIAAAVGQLLKYALPKSWVTPPAFGRPTGFLQQTWARSIVGGCLFVGVRDALMLYVRWRVAQNHHKRGVLDHDRSKSKKSKKKSARV